MPARISPLLRWLRIYAWSFSWAWSLPCSCRGGSARASTPSQLLGLAIATALATAFGVLWRRRLISIIRALALQGAAVASVALLLGFDRRSFEPIVAAVLVFALKAVLIPVILARRVRQPG